MKRYRKEKKFSELIHEECKILKYVSTLGPEFPQNVKCHGKHGLSYDYTEGLTLKEYLKDIEEYTYMDEVIVLIQLLKINKKLFDAGIYLYDQHGDDFIVDNEGYIHVIDFEYVENPYRSQDEKYETVKIPDKKRRKYEYDCLMGALNPWYESGIIHHVYENALHYTHDINAMINYFENLLEELQNEI